MNDSKKILSVIALVLAVLSFFVSGPLLAAAVIVLAVAMLM